MLVSHHHHVGLRVEPLDGVRSVRRFREDAAVARWRPRHDARVLIGREDETGHVFRLLERF